ncbi:hypothetical protein CTI12_AA462710 [Artemisia annua]|uniref:ATPase, F1/V1/A1 complex, alpha/beta subunit, Zinc knuckle CX2CX4HX4C n=1 Tax=Artemisia annua TaxID=35608 RepID=A0A2U1LRB4_ARTAN|nr:hypothetical protein CTI12_AA462710 [Artemisia annua]
MSNRNRSSSRAVKTPVWFADHVMNNSSSNRSKEELPVEIGEIRVPVKSQKVNVGDSSNQNNRIGDNGGKVNKSAGGQSNVSKTKNTCSNSECTVQVENSKCGNDVSVTVNTVSDTQTADNNTVNVEKTNVNKETVNDVEISVNKEKECVSDNQKNQVGKITNKNEKPSYVNAAKKANDMSPNKLKFIPTVMTEIGKEVVIFDEDVGNPLIMDQTTANICMHGIGRTEYARVLIEMDAKKEFKESVELQYRDGNQQVKGSKIVKVEYDWKPSVCSYCNVFGHEVKQCSKRPRTEEEIRNKQSQKEKESKHGEGVGQVNKQNAGVSNKNVQRGKQNDYTSGGNKNGVSQQNRWKARQQWSKKTSEKTNEEVSKEGKNYDEEFPKLPPKQKQMKEKATSTSTSSNRYSVLVDEETCDVQELNKMNDNKIVDNESENEVVEDESAVAQELTANELDGGGSSLLN